MQMQRVRKAVDEWFGPEQLREPEVGEVDERVEPAPGHTGHAHAPYLQYALTSHGDGPCTVHGGAAGSTS